MSITNKIEYYKESLETFDDTLEKYRFLLDQGKKALPFPVKVIGGLRLRKTLDNR